MHVTDTQNVVELIDLLAFPILPMHIDLSTNQKNKQRKNLNSQKFNENF